MKLKYSYIWIVLVLMGGFACTDRWDEHYDVYPETVNENVWSAMKNDPEISRFIQIMEENDMDTLFDLEKTDIPYTIMAPNNAAMEEYLASDTLSARFLKYHVLQHFVQSANVQGKRKIQTLTEKFALYERNGDGILIDGYQVKRESPLYLNGKYFVMDHVASPRPNFYEFFAVNNPVLKSYIDSRDSVILDREKSKPIGFDEFGRTIYDTVSINFNRFEAKYFPVTEEFRNITGTIVFPRKDDYEAALTEMAQKMGPGYTDFNDIPLDWQYTILMPHLLDQGIFLNMLEPEEFVWDSPLDTLKLQNIRGDSIQIFYTPVDKTILSNGYTYNYQDFTIPDSLFLGPTEYEAEFLLVKSGLNKYAWGSFVEVVTDQNFQPVQVLIPGASNDSVLQVVFTKGYDKRYSVEFETHNLFPRKYVMAVRTHMDIGGVYDYYVNDELVKSFNYYDFVRMRGIMTSVTGARYIPEGRWNKFDMWVENINEYGPAKIRIEYKGPGVGVPSNGLVLDYIQFIPYYE